MAKHLQVTNRNQMLNKLTDLGLFRVMTAAMGRSDDSVRLRAMDVLLAAGQTDPGPLRTFIELGPEQQRLLGLLIQTLADVSEGGLQEQVPLLLIWDEVRGLPQGTPDLFAHLSITESFSRKVLHYAGAQA